MWLRANIVLAIAVVFAVVQMFASATGGPRFGEVTALASSPNSGLTRSVAAQDDNDEDADNEDDSDNSDDADNEDDSDNSDDADNEDDSDNSDDADNEDDSDNSDDEDNDDEDDSDNDDSDSDNDDGDDSDNDDDAGDTTDDGSADIGDDVLDNVDTTAASAAPAATTASAAPSTTTGTPSTNISTVASPAASPQAVTEAQLVTAGMDQTLTLQTDRLAVQVFSTMPAGITLKLRIVDPLMYPATPGIRAGDLIFQLDATDVQSVPLSTLPGEVNISVHYRDNDVTGLDDTTITLGKLDTLDSTWKTAPKLMTDPTTNYLAASVMDTGVYAVYVP